MPKLDRFLALFAVLIVCIAGTRVYDAYAYAATQAPHKRFTTNEQQYLKQFRCNEDEYLVVRSRYINPAVTYDTPARPLCIQIDDHNYRRAPRLN